MSVPLVPLADYVVIEQEKAQTRTASGLYLPEKAAEKPKVAKVLAVGENVKTVKIGDKVVYGGYTNTEVKIGDVEYILVKEENLYAKVK
ncbi:co-chaperone GroES [bacterium]|jgi:chaperonin GroES|nr:co-chaperone GroES [bacterium]NBX98244.1 co-chaperone GroES [bacterium]NDC94652.1 co-chaperone GroES [bacterium]NDD84274.1 co-chaperone GroES [bacterium]NDG29922.1 co-chaperone GroES [bacterium]